MLKQFLRISPPSVLELALKLRLMQERVAESSFVRRPLLLIPTFVGVLRLPPYLFAGEEGLDRVLRPVDFREAVMKLWAESVTTMTLILRSRSLFIEREG